MRRLVISTPLFAGSMLLAFAAAAGQPPPAHFGCEDYGYSAGAKSADASDTGTAAELDQLLVQRTADGVPGAPALTEPASTAPQPAAPIAGDPEPKR